MTDPSTRGQRLFVAARPPAALAARLAGLVADDPGVRPVPVDQLHVTLRFLAAADAATVVDRLRVAELPPAVATVGPWLELLGRDAVVLPVAGLDELAAVVRRALAVADRAPAHRFRGHLTVGRIRRGAVPVVARAPFEASFEVTTVEVVTSELRHDGAVHTVVATLPTR